MADNDLLRLRDMVAGAFARTLEMLLGQAVAATSGGEQATLVTAAKSILWQQKLSIVPDPAVWVYAPEESWTQITTGVLTSAGLDSVTEDDQRSTWSEVIQQSLSAFAAALTADVRREVTAKSGIDIAEPPAGLSWLSIELQGESAQWKILVAFAADLVSVFDPTAFAEVLDRPKSAVRSGVSKTFDLLLDVALPISVSFGKTSLQLREVLKLNTGSIVELDRFVAEPVDVVVNDCVIARGDVVVVDGNYGVRIRQLASREDRLRTGVSDLTGVTSRKP